MQIYLGSQQSASTPHYLPSCVIRNLEFFSISERDLDLNSLFHYLSYHRDLEATQKMEVKGVHCTERDTTELRSRDPGKSDTKHCFSLIGSTNCQQTMTCSLLNNPVVGHRAV